jgi:dynein heavy chain 1
MQGSAIQEINFWLAIERSLAQVQQQQKSSLVSITLELLRATGNVPLTFRFLNDTELDSKLKTAQNYNTLLRDFAINSLLSATDLD